MIEFQPAKGDLVLDKIPKTPQFYNEIDSKRSYVFRDSKDIIHEFTEFDSLYHIISTVESLHDNQDLKGYIRNNNPDGENDDYRYSENNEWTYGTTYPNRLATMDALLSSKVEDTMWIAIDKLRNSLLKDKDIQRLMELAPTIKKTRKFGMSGDELCIDRVLSGDPQHWQYTTKGRKNNVVRIALNISMSAGNKADSFLKLAAVASVAADLVSKAGAALEFTMIAFSCNVCRDDENPYRDENGNTIGKYTRQSVSGYLAPIKKAEEPFELTRIASLGIPGLFRHYIFCLKTATGSTKPSRGLGSSYTTSPDILNRFGLKHVIELKHSDSQSNQKLFLNDIFSELAGVNVEDMEPA